MWIRNAAMQNYPMFATVQNLCPRTSTTCCDTQLRKVSFVPKNNPTFRSRKNSFSKNIWMVPVKKRASPSIPVVTHNIKPKVAVFHLNSYCDVFWSSPSSPLFFPTCTKVHVCCALVLVVFKDYAYIIHIFDVCDRFPHWQV